MDTILMNFEISRTSDHKLESHVKVKQSLILNF